MSDFVHFTCIKSGEVFAYKSVDEAIEWHENYSNLKIMSDEDLNVYLKNRPIGGVWSHNMEWVVDKEKYREEVVLKKKNRLLDIERELDELDKQISRYERLEDISVVEREELDNLYKQSNNKFREYNKLKRLEKL